MSDAVSKFLTTLDVRLYFEDAADHSHWMLLADLVYESAVLGARLTVPKGFVTDFASVPKQLPLAYALFGDLAHKPAVVHDYMYQTHVCGEKAMADDIFYEAMGVVGMPDWKRKAMWEGVHVGGQGAWDTGLERFKQLNPGAHQNRP